MAHAQSVQHQAQKKTEQKITKDMTIGDVVQEYPQVIETLMSLGVHCVGCHVSTVETIEEGFKGHGMTDQEVNEGIQKLNKALTETPSATHHSESNEPVIVTETAVKKINELLKLEKKDGYGLRFQVLPGGCSGYQYGLDFEEKATNEDTVLMSNGIQVFIDPESLQMLKGVTLDYVESLQGGGFKISNPNAKKSCGCGSSFS